MCASHRFRLFIFLLAASLVITCNLPTQLGGTPAPSATSTSISGNAAPTTSATLAPASNTALEKPVSVIPLQGPAARPQAELSGLAWYGDYLILLPQFPQRINKNRQGGALLALPRSAILDYIEGRSLSPLNPIEVPLNVEGLDRKIPGFEGFEAIAFLGERAYLTIEAGRAGKMTGYLVAGTIAPDLSELRLDASTLVENPPQVDQPNHTDEALLIVGNAILTFFESNGAAVNPSPHGTRFDTNLRLTGILPFPPIEYRVTDATAPDNQNRFWVINYFFPGDINLKPVQDPLASLYGLGTSHTSKPQVERLVELQYLPEGITFSDTPPVYIQLAEDARNWEGLVRLEGYGFLVVTDKHPETILGFVPYP